MGNLSNRDTDQHIDRMAVPEVVINRLPQYVRVLKSLISDEIQVVNSQLLGKKLQITPTQIRKDLSYFGRFGKQGRGYSVNNLLEELKQILGLNYEWNVVLVGVGRLGRAILSYPGFNPDGFHLIAAIDNNPDLIGQEFNGLLVSSIDDLSSLVVKHNISIAIVSVPTTQTQQVIDRVIECGIESILNYAPTTPQVPTHVKITNIDPVISLQSMTYHLVN